MPTKRVNLFAFLLKAAWIAALLALPTTGLWYGFFVWGGAPGALPGFGGRAFAALICMFVSTLSLGQLPQNEGGVGPDTDIRLYVFYTFLCIATLLFIVQIFLARLFPDAHETAKRKENESQ